MSMRPDQGVPGTWRGAPGVMAGDPASVGRRLAAGWSPTVGTLLLLVFAEIGAYVALRVFFKSAHGG